MTLASASCITETDIYKNQVLVKKFRPRKSLGDDAKAGSYS